MADKDQQELAAKARLVALRKNPPALWNQAEVDHFHDVVHELEVAHDHNFSQFRIPRERMNQGCWAGNVLPILDVMPLRSVIQPSYFAARPSQNNRLMVSWGISTVLI